VAAAAPDPLDNLRTALTGAGLGAALLGLLRRGFDAWQKRQQLQAEQKQQAGKTQKDASEALRAYMERRMEELRSQVQVLSEEASARERRYDEEVRSHVRRLDEMERREARVNAALVEFVAVVTTVLPDMPDRLQRHIQNALDRLRQVSGLG
jgi:iron-sulfur cluster repair protein YtfE (RIC family)